MGDRKAIPIWVVYPLWLKLKRGLNLSYGMGDENQPTLRKTALMTSLTTERRGVNTTQIFAESIAQVKTEMQKRLEREVERKLNESITQMLQRASYGRRSEVPNWVEIEGKRQRCGSRKSQRFSRNGGRTRGLLTL